MLEAALQKSGAELFRELLRLYPTAELDDYWKMGMWKNDQMKTDLVLLEAHRREAGAPDPIPLEDVKMPDLPAVAKHPAMMALAGGKGVVPPMAMMMGTAPAAATSTASGGPVAELRLIALFVAKWKLDPTKTKLMLAKMTPTRRRYIIQNFKTAFSGPEANAALDAYIAQCEKSGDWDKGSIAPAASAAMQLGVARAAVGAAKRPIMPGSMVLDPNKRPRIGPMGTPTAPGAVAAAWAAKAATIRAGASGVPILPGGAKVIAPIRPAPPKQPNQPPPAFMKGR